MRSHDIRTSFLRYFEQNGHRIVASAPLVPADDPTLLFTNAGMNQFKDVFLGREKRDYTRATTSQKCMRVSGKHNDLDNVGRSLRHHTFFEMLGNFSFGDYFKRDAIRFAWELLVGEWGMAPEQLVPSIFKGESGIPRDDEAYDIWRQFVPADRILELGLSDNFWQMGETGPCGRCSEIYYVGKRGGAPELEIWNNVFMEFERAADGSLSPLPAPSIDTGMGLERITAVLQNKPSNYDTDIFTPLLGAIGELSGRAYGTDPVIDVSMRVVADHVRATTFLIGDGVMPSNEWRGYVLRKIMRRAMRHGRHLGLAEPFLHTLVPVLEREMGHAYPELRANGATIARTILAEEQRFDAVLTEGLPRLEAEIAAAAASGGSRLSGQAVFRLYDTFGLPFDFIEDTAATHRLSVDRAGYERAMEGQRDRARASGSFEGDRKGGEFRLPDPRRLTEVGDVFEGYATTRLTGVPVMALFDEQRHPVEALGPERTGYVVLARTPFYVESGGQVSDTGRIVSDTSGAVTIVEGITRIGPGLPRAHRVRVLDGELSVRDRVTAEVDAEVRNATRRNHTATHLLHAALRQVLGTHVKQAGSLVAPDRLRFDFVHFQPVGRADLERLEGMVNAHILENAYVQTDVRPTREAIESGAMALFGEKYGDEVRVVSIPGVSMELCGGTHVAATGEIGFFAIQSEGGVAAGVRRIEAVTGRGALEWVQAQRSTLADVIGALNVNPDQAIAAVEGMRHEAKRLSRELMQLRTKLAMGGGYSATGTNEAVEISGVKLARRKAEDLDKEGLRQLADALKAQIKSGVVVIASSHDGRVQVVVAVTPDLTARLKAGQIVKELAPIVGGGGGGRAEFAEAGGRHPEKIDALLAASETVVARLLAG
jgi:alanyl-tRNA synthetase